MSDAHAGHHHGPAHLHHHFDDIGQQRECTSLAMWAFLCTEIMMFGGMFFAYTLYRWMYGGAYHEGAAHQNVGLGFLNTCALIVSSFTMACAVHFSATENRKALVRCLILTWILGAVFLIVKGFEWTHDYHLGLIPGVNWTFYDVHPDETARLLMLNIWPDQIRLYFTIYFMMTGLHAIHMIVGLGLLGAFIYLSAKGQFSKGNDQPVEIMGLYWHFVDIVWVFLFPMLYLIAGFDWMKWAPLGGH